MTQANRSYLPNASYGDPQLYAMAPTGWPAQSEDTDAGGVTLGLLIWAPAILLAIPLFMMNQKLPAVVVMALAGVVHTLLRPHVTVYILIAAIPLEWLVTFIPGVSTLTKLLGLYALLLSTTRLIPAALPTRWDKTGRWMLLLILWAALSIFWSPVPQAALKGWQSFALRWGIAVLICIQLTNRKRLYTGMLVLVVACLLSSLVYLSNYDSGSIVGGNTRDALTNVVGEAVDVSGSLNLLARYKGVGIITALFLALISRGGWRRTSLLLTIPIIAIAVLMLKGRAVYLGLPVAMLGALILLGGAGIGRRLLLGIVLASVAGLSAFVIVRLGFFGEGIVQRFSSIFEQGVESGNRIVYWKRHIEAFFDSFGLGVGIEQMAAGYKGSYTVAHNDWLSIAGELGIIGLFFFAMFHLTLGLRIHRLKQVWAKMYCLMIWLFMLMVGLTEDDFCTKFYALATGLVLALIQIEEHDANHELAPWGASPPRALAGVP